MAERTVVSKVTNAVLYSDGTIRLDNVRASYPHLDKPYAGEDGGEPKFGIVAMLSKETHVAAKDLLVKVIDKLCKEADIKVAADKKFIRNGDDSDKETYEGHWTVSARESRRPSVRDRRGDPMDQDDIPDVIHGGVIVNVLIRPWVQDNKYGKRVNAGLVAVQFVKDDGVSFGEGRVSDEGVFGAIEGDDDDDSGGL